MINIKKSLFSFNFIFLKYMKNYCKYCSLFPLLIHPRHWDRSTRHFSSCPRKQYVLFIPKLQWYYKLIDHVNLSVCINIVALGPVAEHKTVRGYKHNASVLKIIQTETVSITSFLALVWKYILAYTIDECQCAGHISAVHSGKISFKEVKTISFNKHTVIQQVGFDLFNCIKQKTLEYGNKGVWGRTKLRVWYVDFNSGHTNELPISFQITVVFDIFKCILKFVSLSYWY